MKIASVEFVALSAPLAEGKAYGMSKLLATGRQSTLVILTLEDGTTGHGEAWGPPAFNQAFLPLLAGYLAGTDVFDVEHIYDRILARHYHFGLQNPMMTAISGIDIAAKDAAGKLLGVPVCRLIGGRNLDAVPIYASGGYLTESPEADYAPQIEQMARDSHRAAKIKIGLSPESDEARLALARQILGDDVEILVDINTNYTFDIAAESVARMRPYRPGWVEEPLAPRDYAGLARLHKMAGVWQGRKIAELAHAHAVRVSPHVWGGAVGLAAALHFIAALSVYPHAENVPKPVLLEYDLGENPLRSELLRTPLAPVDGVIAVPDGPGLGIDINPDAVARFAKR